MAVVYRHIRLDKNLPFYIGIGVSKKRAYQTHNRNEHWKNIVNKTPYEVEIIFDDLTNEEAQEKEKEFIALYGREKGGLLCNRTDGGEWTQGMKWGDEVRKKMSHSAKTNEKRKLLRQKIADERRGKEIPWQKKMALGRVGGKRSESFKKKISDKNLSRDKEVWERIAAKHRGMKRSEKTKFNMSFAKQLKKMMGYVVSGYSSVIVNTKKIRRNGET